MKTTLMTALVATLSLTLLAERQPYERYQSIVDRQMFGEPPPGFDPTRPPSEVSAREQAREEAELTKEQAEIKSAIHFSVINVTPDGATAVGFTDSGDPKNPVHYYLKVGESANGWLVREADPVKATMTIAKGEVEVSLSIGGSSGGAKGAKGAGGGEQAAALAAPSRRALSARGGSSLGSLRERRMAREQMRAEEAAAEAARRAEEERRREEERARAEEEAREQQAEEREATRAQLMQMRDELRRMREEKKEEEGKPDAEESEDE